MSHSFVSVNVPFRGGFGQPVGGGGQDPRKPGSSKPGREHEEDAEISRQARKDAKKRRKHRAEALAQSSRETFESDVEMGPPLKSRARDDDVEMDPLQSSPPWPQVDVKSESSDDDVLFDSLRLCYRSDRSFGVELPASNTNKQL
ncbi:MAG: hypothetical protein ASARMPRED_009224 [Alectoria sarmentosa]|nr:MAG: hypothetical protein ASARMPRED_009224 [Alectoria sarmentosa]